MKSLNSEYLQKQPITHNLLQTIRRIAEYKGKQDLSGNLRTMRLQKSKLMAQR
jgi:hypothetical protein